MGEESNDTHQELWEKYMKVEHKELDRIAEEDLCRAQEGLVELRSGDDVWYKHINELTREDRQARIESENARTAWLRERLSRQSPLQ